MRRETPWNPAASYAMIHRRDALGAIQPVRKVPGSLEIDSSAGDMEGPRMRVAAPSVRRSPISLSPSPGAGKCRRSAGPYAPKDPRAKRWPTRIAQGPGGRLREVPAAFLSGALRLLWQGRPGQRQIPASGPISIALLRPSPPPRTVGPMSSRPARPRLAERTPTGRAGALRPSCAPGGEAAAERTQAPGATRFGPTPTRPPAARRAAVAGRAPPR